MLTTAQRAVLQTDVQLDAALMALPHNSDGAWAVAEAYNKAATPNYVIWNARTDPNSILENGMVWADFKNLSVGQIAIWERMTEKGYINATKVNERVGLEEAFGKNSATNVNLQSHLKIAATRLEKLFATGAGTDASPSTPTVTGMISWSEVQEAIGW